MRDDPALARLERALEDVGAALAGGAFAGLGPLTGELDAALAAVEAHPPADRAALDRLAARARGNMTMLAAAARGVRAARQRLRDLTAAGQGIGTYDRDGRRTVIGPGADRPPHRS